MIGIILSIILILLGVLGAEMLILEKAPPVVKMWVAKLHLYREPIGVTGLIFSTLSFLEWLTWLPHAHAPSRMIIWLIVVILTFSLGLIFGLEPIRRNLKDPNAGFFVTAESWRLKLIPVQNLLGIAGIVVGLLYFIVSL